MPENLNVAESRPVDAPGDSGATASQRISPGLGRGGLSRVREFFGVDQAILFSVLNTIRSMMGGPLIALLITMHFTPVVQGFYYTFSSVLALQVFAEMGLSAVLLQFASHEWAGLRYDRSGVVGDPDNLSRLADIVRLAAIWYAVAAAVAAVGLMAGGYFFFRRQDHSEVLWALPWCCLCGLTGLKLFLVPFFSILEGCGQVRQVYAYRLAEGILSLVTAAIAIPLGAGLWTAVAITSVVLLANLSFLGWRYGRFYRSLLAIKIGARVSWSHEILPMQWRIAISWMSGYFIFQLFMPVLFSYQGPILAGQFGLAWSIVSAVSSVSTAWINTKVPQFGALIARREFASLDRLARRAAVGAISVASLGAVGALGLLFALRVWAPAIAPRFLPIAPCAVLLTAVVLLQLSYAQSSYLRAHKREPFLWLSVFGSLLMGLSTWYFGSRYGVAEMAWGYLAVIVFFTLPVGSVVFVRRRREWHAEPLAASQL